MAARPGSPQIDHDQALAALNPTTHPIDGAESPFAVIPGVEREADWEVHRARVFESLSPAGYVQEEVIERLALLLWRQRRVSRYETDMIILARELAEEDWAHGQRAQTGDQRPPELLPATIRRHLDRTRCNQQLLERVLVLPDGTRVDADDALAVLTCVCDQTEGVKLSDLPLPAIPDGLATEQSDSWTMGQVRGVLESIANLAGQRFRPCERGAGPHADPSSRAFEQDRAS